MDLGLTGRVAMISGASRGIGKTTASGMAAEGCRPEPLRPGPGGSR